MLNHASKAVPGSVQNYDEAPEINSIRAHIEQQTDTLIADGMSSDDANRQASYRAFGSKPGAYGVG